MAIYKYTIKNHEGQIRKGKMHAASKLEAVDVVKKQGYFILELKKGKLKKQKMPAFERINFTDHLASLIRAGTPIRDALEAYADDGAKRMSMVDSVIKTIEQGKKMSHAFSEFPEIFTPLYISLIKAGEHVGNLDETLEYLASELRREHEFKQRVRSAMFYPALVISVALMVITLIFLIVVPKITEITQNLGADMPFTTKVVLGISSFMSNYTPFVLAGILALVASLFFLFKNENVRQRISKYMLSMPVIGKVIKKYTLARLLRTLSSSIKYGIPLADAFESTEDVVGNIVYKRACRNMSRIIQKGNSLSHAFASQGKGLFPGLIVRTVKGAEKTGGLDSSLSRLATQYEAEVDRDLKRMTELIEPVMVVVLGIIVLGIALSVVAPIYQLTSKIK